VKEIPLYLTERKKRERNPRMEQRKKEKKIPPTQLSRITFCSMGEGKKGSSIERIEKGGKKSIVHLKKRKRQQIRTTISCEGLPSYQFSIFAF